MGAPGGGTGPQKNPCRLGGHFGIKHGFKLTQNNCRMISKSPKRFRNLTTITYTEIIPLNPMGHLNLLGEHLRICAAKHPESQATCRTILFAMPPLAVVVVVVCGLCVCTLVSTQCYKVFQETSLFPRQTSSHPCLYASRHPYGLGG